MRQWRALLNQITPQNRAYLSSRLNDKFITCYNEKAACRILCVGNIFAFGAPVERALALSNVYHFPISRLQVPISMVYSLSSGYGAVVGIALK